jgi:putative ABC transport system permease protein
MSANIALRIGQGVARWAPAAAASFTSVPLAWRNFTADKRRLIRSASGIAFAVVLILVQLGFRQAFLDSALQVIRAIDGDIFLTSSTKFRFGRKDPFPRRQLYQARAAPGVASASPIYAEWTKSIWKNPQTSRTYNVQVLAFYPDQPVFFFPEVQARLQQLKQPDTVMLDRRARRFIGQVDEGSETELARREVRVVGTFSLGPDFTTDGTVITGDRTFLTLFSDHVLEAGELADVEFGVIKLRPGAEIETVQRALRQALPAGVAVRTKAELLALEANFQNSVSPAGPIFALGTFIGFAVGMLISYQILFTDLSDQSAQYATLKAIGYDRRYLVGVVLAQAIFYGLAGCILAWPATVLLDEIIGTITLLPLRMTVGLAVVSLGLAAGMCVLAALVAVRRVLAADPAELF